MDPSRPAEETSTQTSERWADTASLTIPDDVRQNIETFGLEKLKIRPHPWQIEAASAVVGRRDVVVIAATGDGKTAVFQLLNYDTDKTQLVISPLIGLIGEQVEKLKNQGIKALALTADTLRAEPRLWQKIHAGDFQVVYATPEMVLMPSSPFWHKVVMDKTHPFASKLGSIIIDEAHVVWKWGKSGFRIEYRNIGLLRSHLRNVPIVLVSATLAPNIRGYLWKSVSLSSPTYILQRSVLRSNIALVCARTEKPLGDYGDLDFLAPTDVPSSMLEKTMVFVDSRNVAQQAAFYLRTRLGGGTMQYSKEQCEVIVGVYTAVLTTSTRDVVMERFKAGECRILICTDAAGMGMDIRNVSLVVQYRIPKGLTIADLYQRLGRCARDPSIRGLGLVLVDAKYIFPHTFADPEGEDSENVEYHLAVTAQPSAEVSRFLKRLYARFNDEASKDMPETRKIDPGVLWFVNTHGCRARSVLAVFADPQTHSNWQCRCDNCHFPERETYDTAVDTTTTDEDMQYRDEAILEHRNFAKRCVVGFPYTRSLRYEDTAAFVADKAREEADRLIALERGRKLSDGLRFSITNALYQWRKDIAARDRHLIFCSGSELLPTKLLSKIAANCLRIETQEQLRIVLGAKYDLPTSILGDYADDLIRLVNQVVDDYDADQREVEGEMLPPAALNFNRPSAGSPAPTISRLGTPTPTQQVTRPATPSTPTQQVTRPATPSTPVQTPPVLTQPRPATPIRGEESRAPSIEGSPAPSVRSTRSRSRSATPMTQRRLDEDGRMLPAVKQRKRRKLDIEWVDPASLDMTVQANIDFIARQEELARYDEEISIGAAKRARDTIDKKAMATAKKKYAQPKSVAAKKTLKPRAPRKKASAQMPSTSAATENEDNNATQFPATTTKNVEDDNETQTIDTGND